VSNAWLGFLVEPNEVVLVWQTSHESAAIGTWLATTPLAVLPWQLEQVPATTPVWLNAAPANDVVDLWQVSHAAVVAMWVADLPLAVVPL
jgi:hypothetical protein